MTAGKTAKAGHKAKSVIAGTAAAFGSAAAVLYFLPNQSPDSEPDGKQTATPLVASPPAAPIAATTAPDRAPYAPRAATAPSVGVPSVAATTGTVPNLEVPNPDAPNPVISNSVTPAALMPPRFDLVRVEQDGSALVAGKSAPNSTVSVLVGDAVVATATGDRSGGFVAMFDLTYSSQPRVVTLLMRLANGSEIASEEQVILSPANVAPPPFADSTAPVATAVLSTDATAPALPAQVNSSLLSEIAPLPGSPSDAPSAPLQASEAPAAILVGPMGVKVLQNGSGQAGAAIVQGDIQPVIIDTIAYTESGAVQLGGRATAGMVVRLYLNRAFSVEMGVGRDGSWGGILPDVAPGIYTLRADQVDAAGKVTARFETPFQRETQASLAALLPPVKPAPSQTGVAPQADVALAPTTIGAAAPAQTAQPVVGAAPDARAAQPNAVATEAPTRLGTANSEPLAPVAAPNPVVELAPDPVSVTVQPGFTLWAIARDRFGEGILYVQVYEANKDRIRNPDLIYPGQVFAIPSLPNPTEALR